MEVSMETLLATLWMKTLLNWVVVLVQKGHVGRSFCGVFCVSLALGDALLHLSITCIFLVQDVQMFTLHLTKYHVCVLVQMACSIQWLLHWPVFILSALDVLWSARRPCPRPTQMLVHNATTLLLWTLSALYVFTVPDSHPITRDQDDHVTLQLCQVICGAQSRQVAWASLLMLVGMACYMIWVRSLNAEQLRECLGHFLSTWSSFLLLLLFILLSGTEVPPYLEMNGVWLCFIHSLHNAVALRSCSCIFCTHTQDDMWKSRTSHSHVCSLTDKYSLTSETLTVQVPHTRRLT
ncbi:probable G-protein coupled receptor 160 [Tachysurus fulvidraco]|uniref:probable G-protein coupled receptor 160 n=1 Tax=Tachysurus fulvidraco TaxID=1234273 RepID=UPI000F4DE5EF|nr:probable G-protein coupled receptor 160 [Tachysurus fulvidraco]